MSLDDESSPPEVAIVGAGLAGLSAAVTLRKLAKHVRVSIFEKESRIGGRVLTCDRPRGEHGAEFVLSSEPTIVKLLRSLGVGRSASVGYGACRFEGRTARGSFNTMARHALGKESSATVMRVLQVARKANRSGRYSTGDRRGQSLIRQVGNNTRARRFLQMLLAGETCAPWNHLSVQTALGSLDESDARRIALGSEQLVKALRCAIPEARLSMGVDVTSVQVEGGSASVSWRQNGQQYRAPFGAVIITTPDGEQFLPRRRRRQQPSPHFHAYISVLLEYRSRWWTRSLPELRDGLYTDGFINFVEEVPTRTPGRHVLRILLPNAERWLPWDDGRVKTASIRHLWELSLSKSAEHPTRWSIKRWPYGLPCGGAGIFYDQISHRPPIYLAGDRLSKWPSMNGALESGQRAAASLAQSIRSTRDPRV